MISGMDAVLVALVAAVLVLLGLLGWELLRQRRELAELVTMVDDVGRRLPDARAQAWFWTDQWQAGERAVDGELLAGKGTVFPSDNDFLSVLGARVSAPAQMPPAR